MITRGYTQTNVVTRGFGPWTISQFVEGACVFLQEKREYVFKRAKQKVLFKRPLVS